MVGYIRKHWAYRRQLVNGNKVIRSSLIIHIGLIIVLVYCPVLNNVVYYSLSTLFKLHGPELVLLISLL